MRRRGEMFGLREGNTRNVARVEKGRFLDQHLDQLQKFWSMRQRMKDFLALHSIINLPEVRRSFQAGRTLRMSFGVCPATILANGHNRVVDLADCFDW